MKTKLTVLALITLAACGDKGGERVEVQVPGPTVTVEAPADAPVQCQVWANKPVMPTAHEVKGDALVELNSLNFPEEPNDLLPFTAFLGTAAEAITNNFSMRCSLKFEVTQAGSHKFSLTSDDGSELYVNGVRLINNGGSHGMLLKTGTITLPLGVHELRVHFFEGNGPKGLDLKVQRPALLPPAPETL